MHQLFETLYNHFGPQDWWPGETTLEILIGAILTQNTSWHNVTKAITRLKEQNAITLNTLHMMPIDTLAALIQPAGYFNIKAKRLKAFMHYLIEQNTTDLMSLSQKPTMQLRNELLMVSGIGPETADSMLLYGFHKPIFVIDTYTIRIFERHHLIKPHLSYHAVQQIMMENLPHDVALFNEYHALLVALGKSYCRTKPLCQNCSWADDLKII